VLIIVLIIRVIYGLDLIEYVFVGVINDIKRINL